MSWRKCCIRRVTKTDAATFFVKKKSTLKFKSFKSLKDQQMAFLYLQTNSIALKSSEIHNLHYPGHKSEG